MLLGFDPKRSLDAILVNAPLKDYNITPRLHNYTLPVLGLGYIATYAKTHGLNVAVLDTEAYGIGIKEAVDLINSHSPRWVGLNLLAPTYRYAVQILSALNPEILVMLGGHQVKAMPREIIGDLSIPRIDALVLGEGEYRAKALFMDVQAREYLPGVWWRDAEGTVRTSANLFEIDKIKYWLAPNIDELPFIDRTFLAQDPDETLLGDKESAMVGSRGCPYDCSFCGAAISANPDTTIRVRSPQSIIAEMQHLSMTYGVNRFRFVDDLFLANHSFIKACLSEFVQSGVGTQYRWDATGRINILAKVPDSTLELIKASGCREVALGIESGSDRVLDYMNKRINTKLIVDAVSRLTSYGISVKGYFILGYPTETASDLDQTIRLIETLWAISDRNAGDFRCSVFEFRPYPGTSEFNKLLKTGKYTATQLLNYSHIDLTQNSEDLRVLERDKFNFSVNLQFGEVPLVNVRQKLAAIMTEQKQRLNK